MNEDTYELRYLESARDVIEREAQSYPPTLLGALDGLLGTRA